ncbi:MAG: non-heme iron oxygenase ferredoxin subunit [Panacagrimonas sp.]
MSQAFRACGEHELADGEMRAVEDAPESVAICKVAGEWYAFANNCTHEDFPLTEGLLDGGEVECPLHGARFCVRTGAARAVPASCGIKVFPVRVEKGEVMIEIAP